MIGNNTISNNLICDNGWWKKFVSATLGIKWQIKKVTLGSRTIWEK